MGDAFSVPFNLSWFPLRGIILSRHRNMPVHLVTLGLLYFDEIVDKSLVAIYLELVLIYFCLTSVPRGSC